MATHTLEATTYEGYEILAKPLQSAESGDWQVNIDILIRRVLLHYRNLDQTDDWQHLAMKETGDGLFTTTIPGEAVSARYDLMYYLEARLTGGGTLWPDWRKQQPYVVVPTIPEE